MLNRKHGQAILAGFVLVAVMVFYVQAQDGNSVYTISGRVTDGNGNGVGGVTVTAHRFKV